MKASEKFPETYHNHIYEIDKKEYYIGGDRPQFGKVRVIMSLRMHFKNIISFGKLEKSRRSSWKTGLRKHDLALKTCL